MDSQVSSARIAPTLTVPTDWPTQSLSEEAYREQEEKNSHYSQHRDVVLMKTLDLVVTVQPKCSMSKQASVGSVGIEASPVDDETDFHDGEWWKRRLGFEGDN